jgi:hypothetical protein
MAILIKTGEGKPTIDNLLDKQLGFDTLISGLYIRIPEDKIKGKAAYIDKITVVPEDIIMKDGRQLQSYIDEEDYSRVLKSGDIMTGQLYIETGGLIIETGGLKIGSEGIEIDSDGLIIHEDGEIIEDGGLEIQKGGILIKAGGLLIEDDGINVKKGGLQIDEGGITLLDDDITLPEKDDLAADNTVPTSNAVTIAIYEAKLSIAKHLEPVLKFADLPTPDVTDRQNYLCKVLEETIGTGTSTNPQYPEGLYQRVPEGTEWKLYGKEKDFIDEAELEAIIDHGQDQWDYTTP